MKGIVKNLHVGLLCEHETLLIVNRLTMVRILMLSLQCLYVYLGKAKLNKQGRVVFLQHTLFTASARETRQHVVLQSICSCCNTLRIAVGFGCVREWRNGSVTGERNKWEFKKLFL